MLIGFLIMTIKAASAARLIRGTQRELNSAARYEASSQRRGALGEGRSHPGALPGAVLVQ